MKNIQSMLFFFELVNQWRFHTAVDVFELKESKKYKNMFSECFVGLSHPLSRYEMYLTSKKGTNGIGLMLEDRETNQPSLFGNLQNYGGRTILYPSWMYLPMHSTKIVYMDESLEVDRNIAEDEHFQMTMLYNLPDHQYIKPACEVYDYLEKIARKHSIGFDLDYQHLDLDLSEFIPAELSLNIIDSMYENALELLFEAENHGNPFNHYVVQ
jgi:hypothetical protein